MNHMIFKLRKCIVFRHFYWWDWFEDSDLQLIGPFNNKMQNEDLKIIDIQKLASLAISLFLVYLSICKPLIKRLGVPIREAFGALSIHDGIQKMDNLDFSTMVLLIDTQVTTQVYCGYPKPKNHNSPKIFIHYESRVIFKTQRLSFFFNGYFY